MGRSEKDAEAALAGRAARRGGGRTLPQHSRGGTTHHDDGDTTTRHRTDAASSHRRMLPGTADSIPAMTGTAHGMTIPEEPVPVDPPELGRSAEVPSPLSFC